MKIKFDSDDNLPLNKMTDIYNVTIVSTAIVYENNKYYPQVFLDECFCKLYKQTRKLSLMMKKQKYNL